MNPDIDRISFADSDQFDEDSVNSWLSDSEDQVNNWRGWKKSYNINTDYNNTHIDKKFNQPKKLIKQAAKVVAAIQPGFDLTERGVPFPEELIKLIAFYSFPAKEEEIRLYSCLGCGNIDEYIRGENLYKTKAVKECLQIGFHLSAKVLRRPQPQEPVNNNLPSAQTVQYDQGFNYTAYFNSNNEFGTGTGGGTKHNTNNVTDSQLNKHLSLSHPIICKVGITFDRGRITSCHCSCYQEIVDPAWCCHVVAACLYRINEAATVKIRAPISESLSKLTKEDLQKFSQFLISKMTPADILPAAQNILDELLASSNNPLKSVRGAPDLTAGASSEDQPNWYFDHLYIHENISKILQKFCVPKPIVYGDPRHLSNNLPLVAQEYQNILRPMRGKEPEGIWNLISIIRDMFRREDSNAIGLLRILSKCLLDSKPIIMWWYCIKLNQEWCLRPPNSSGGGNNSTSGNSAHHHPSSISATATNANSSLHSQYASSYFCDEMVELWRLTALKYCLSTCKFLTTRRLQAHEFSGHISPNQHQQHNHPNSNNTHNNPSSSLAQIEELMSEIALLHRQVIKTAIYCLDRQQPPSTFFTNQSYNNNNNFGTNSSRNNTRNSNNSSNNTSGYYNNNNLNGQQQNSIYSLLFSKEAQKQFLGFKPALKACKLCIELHKIHTNKVSQIQHFNEPLYKTLLSTSSNVDEDDDDIGVLGNDKVNNSNDTEINNDSDENNDASTSSSSNDNGSSNNNAIKILSIHTFLGFFDTCQNSNKNEVKISDLKFAQCESLFYNGYFNESAQLAHEIAEDLLDKKQFILDKMYREARTSLIESHQKLNSTINNNNNNNNNNINNNNNSSNNNYNSSRGYNNNNINNNNNHNSNNSNNKSSRRFRNSTNNNNNAINYNTSNMDPSIDVELIYPAKTLIRRIQFLINCLVSDCVDTGPILPTYRIFMPSKSRLMEVALELLTMALQLPRPPAPYRQLEVFMIQLEIDLVSQALQIKWANHVVNYKRKLADIALQLKNKSLPYLTEIHIPYNLASFIFEQLTGCIGNNGTNGANQDLLLMNNNLCGNNKMRQRLYSRSDRSRSRLSQTDSTWDAANNHHSSNDEVNTDQHQQQFANTNLAFEGALSVLSMKTKITEQIDPLLVEGQRRLRDEFSAFLLNVYKDDVNKLTLILKQILDPQLNPYFKAASLSFYMNTSIQKMFEPIENYNSNNTNNNNNNNATPSALSPSTSMIPNYFQSTSSSKLSSYFPSSSPSSTSTPTTASSTPTTASVSIVTKKDCPITMVTTSTSPMKTKELINKEASSNGDNNVNKNKLNVVTTSIASGTTTNISGNRYSNKSKSIDTNKTNSSIDTDSSALEDDNSEASINERKFEQKLRCLTTTKRGSANQHSTGMAAIDSSAPETTESSDNSPTTIRKRIFPLYNSNSNSNTNNSNSAGASSKCNASILYSVTCNGEPCGGDKVEEQDLEEEKEDENDMGNKVENGDKQEKSILEDIVKEEIIESESVKEQPISTTNNDIEDSESVECVEENNEKPIQDCEFDINDDQLSVNKESAFDTCLHNNLNNVQESVTESLAHHMFELAQTVLQKAGIPDDSCTPVFRVTSISANNGAVNSSGGQSNTQANSANSNIANQRNLQLCAFQLGLYALGLYNQLNALWQSRTYSSHVAWISTQVVEASGPGPACVLWHSWRHHLTPSEVAETAFRVSRRRLGNGSDTMAGATNSMGRAGAELCLAVLREGCSALNPSQIVRGLRQCSDQSPQMLERGLVAVERGADSSLSGVQPVIYFHLAQAWFQLYKSETTNNNNSSSNNNNYNATTTSTTSTTNSNTNNTAFSSVATTAVSVNNANISSPTSSTMLSYPHMQPYPQFMPHPSNSMMPQIPQLMGNIIISPRSSQGTALAAAYPGSPYMQTFATVTHSPANCNPVWIYNNIVPNSGRGLPTPAQQQQHQIHMYHQQMMQLFTNSHQAAAAAALQLNQQQQHQQQNQTVLPRNSNYTQASPTQQQQQSFNSNDSILNQMAFSQNNDYLVRSFNTAMRAIHILFQLNNSSVAGSSNGSVNQSTSATSGVASVNHQSGSMNPGTMTNDLSGGTSGSVLSNTRRHHSHHGHHSHHNHAHHSHTHPHSLLFNSNPIDSLDASVSSVSVSVTNNNINSHSPTANNVDCHSHDNNIRWTLKIAKLLGPDEVNQFCLVLLQFVQNPFLIKHVVLDVMEYFHLSHNSIISAAAAAVVSVPSSTPSGSSLGTASASSVPVSNPIIPPYYSPVAVLPSPNHSQQPPLPSHPPPLQPPTSGLLNHHYPHNRIFPYNTTNNAQMLHTNTPSYHNYINAHTSATMPPQLQPFMYNNSFNNIPHINNSSTPGATVAPVNASSSSSSSTASISSNSSSAASSNNNINYNGMTTTQQITMVNNHPILSQQQLQNMANNNNNNSNNTYNININPIQTGIELLHKMINRLHYLFRRVIEKRLQQTGQGVRDWDSLVELILEAYRAQRQLPATDPNLSWIEILQKIKTNRKCNKDLWARICTGLQTADQS